MMHTAELDYAVRCALRSLTQWWDAHREAFSKIRISPRNRKYFSLFITQLSGALMGSNHEKNGGRKSRDTLPLNAT